GIVRIGGLFNTAGASVARDVGNVTLTLGFDHLNFVSSTSEFDVLNDASDMGTARAMYRVRPGLDAGIESGGGSTSYEKGVLSDYSTYSVGAFADWKLGSHVQLTGRAGYLDYQY